MRTWKKKYLAEVGLKKGAGARRGVDINVTSLTLLGEKLDEQVKHYLKAVREGGGVITTAITMASATAIVRRADRNLLSEYWGPILITTNWAKSLLYHMGFVKRRGSTTMKITVNNFDSIKSFRYPNSCGDGRYSSRIGLKTGIKQESV